MFLIRVPQPKYHGLYFENSSSSAYLANASKPELHSLYVEILVVKVFSPGNLSQDSRACTSKNIVVMIPSQES